MIAEAEAELGGKPALIHYLAIPPTAFARTTEAIKEHGLADGREGGLREAVRHLDRRASSELDALVHSVFDEEQVYRIDHFLGKEATQNLHMLRFANRLFGDAWNREHIEEVQIDVPEKLDIDDRAEFYDATGAALDMLVTHLFQVAAEVAMEPPLSLSPEDLQAAREAVIAAFRPLDPAEVVLGQYRGYRQTEGSPRLDDRHLRRREAVDRHRPLAGSAVPAAHRQEDGGQRATGQPDLPARGGPLHSTGARRNVLVFDLHGNGAIEIEMTVKKPGPEPLPAEAPPAQPGERRRGLDAALHLAALRRADGEPVPVHEFGGPGGRIPSVCSTAGRLATGPC